MKVNIAPDSLTFINPNLKWKLDSVWYDNNAIVNNIPAGKHTISFTTIAGWIRPVQQQIIIEDAIVKTASGIYLPIPKTGSILIKTIPESIDKGRINAQWRINYGPWKNGSVQLNDVPVGNYTISFNELEGFDKPNDVTVSIQTNNLTTVTGVFNPIVVSDTVQTDLNTSIAKSDLSKTNFEANVCPNPVGNNALTIALNGLKAGKFSLIVYNLTGNTVFSKKYQSGAGNFQTQLDIFKTLPDGIYILQVIQNDSSILKKIIK